jgi:3-methyladenine DNA glycosylase AlkD
MNSCNDILIFLKENSRDENLEGMACFGIVTADRYGVPVPVMRKLAKKIGKNHQLALELWETGNTEARIVASMIADPDQLTEEDMEKWVISFNSWDVCDQVCMNLFDKSPLAWKKVRDWSSRQEEYVKRAAFALLACLAWHDKSAEDQKFTDLLPLISQHADDSRNFVKKSVNWALRNIGKRNKNLNSAALRTAYQMKEKDSKTARWIASDAVRELESPKIQKRFE